MTRSVTGHLRKVRHAKHLVVVTDLMEFLTDGRAQAPADSGVDLIEYQGSSASRSRKYPLQGEHQPRQFTATGDISDRSQGFSRIGAEQDLEMVRSALIHSIPTHGWFQSPQLPFETRLVES
jgi:hypothetical protein